MAEGGGMGELEVHIRACREERNREYKSSFDWSKDSPMRAKVIKAILAMANLPDGGVVVIGMEQDPEGPPDVYIPAGIRPQHLGDFHQDPIQVKVNEFADPYAELTVRRVDVDGRTFVVIQVNAFAEIPVVCRKDSEELQRGAIYTRPRRMIQSVPVPSQAEMREMLDRAVNIRMAHEMQRWLERCPAANVPLRSRDEEAFDAELGDF